jgi:hypothetical protein
MLRTIWEHRARYIAALVVAIGYMLLEPYVNSRWHGSIEAIFIAVFLMLTVDPLAKMEFLKEVNRGVFHLLIGFDLPPKMQERLKRYVSDLKYYRKKLEIRVEAQRESGRLRMHIMIDGTIIAMTDCHLPQSLAFEQAEEPRIIKMEARTAKRTLQWPTGASPAESPDDPMVLRATNDGIDLIRDEEMTSHFSFNIQARETDFWTHDFGTTTLGATVVLVPLPEMEMFASKPYRQPEGQPNVYIYDKVFILGDAIHIRWRPKSLVAHTPPSKN